MYKNLYFFKSQLKSHFKKDLNKFPLGPFPTEIITWTYTQISRKKNEKRYSCLLVAPTLFFPWAKNDKKNLFHHPFFSSSKVLNLFIFYVLPFLRSLSDWWNNLCFRNCSHDLWISNWNVNRINFSSIRLTILGRLSLWIAFMGRLDDNFYIFLFS